MEAAQIKHMVNRFLGWRLPEDFSPDAGISFKPTFNDHLPQPTRHEPTGTNLFCATQAEAMVRYMLDGLPEATLTEETALLKERVRVLEGELKKIRSVIPMNFLIAHDTPGATGPTDALDLVGAIRSLVHNARKWEARARSALHTTPEGE